MTTPESVRAGSGVIDSRDRAVRRVRILAAIVVVLDFVARGTVNLTGGQGRAVVLSLVAIVLTNVLSARLGRQRSRHDHTVALVAVDVVWTLAACLVVSSPDDAPWIVLVIPVATAVVMRHMSAGLVAWSVLAAGYTAGNLVQIGAIGGEAGSVAERLSVVTDQLGLVLLVAIPAGYLTEQLAVGIRHQERATRRAERRGTLLERVADVATDMSSLDAEVEAQLCVGARRLGFVVAQVVRHEDGRDRLLASDGDPTAPHGRVLSLWIDDGRLTSLRAAPPPGREVSRDRRNALDLIVRQAAVALANRQLLDDLRSLTEQLEHQATHDALTGLPNRARLSRHLAELDDEGRQVAFLFCDLDGFKPVNDRLGHDAGDELLIAIAERLRSCVRDRAMVARLGGDEFTVALPDTDAVTAVAIAEELTLMLSEPVALGGGVVRVGVSIGVAHNLGMLAPSELMRRADVAMYRAKAAGRGTVRLYRAEMESPGELTGGTEPPMPHPATSHPTGDGWWPS